MTLKFPIDKNEPREIPEFGGIFSDFAYSVPDLNAMIKYLCYRFDPASEDVHKTVGGIEAKEVKASEKAGWAPPVASVGNDDFGNPILTEEFKAYREVMGEFFWLLDTELFEFICSLEISIHNANMILRDPILGNAEVKSKVLLNMQKATENVSDSLKLKKSLVFEMAKEDKAAIDAIKAKVKVVRAGISPEGQLNGNG
jgi:hypothetical protein